MFRTTLDKLMKIRDDKKAEDGGFTLIELLVVVVIIGILIAIAIPLYLNYEKGSHDAGAESDLRAAITDVTQCYSANGNTYPTSAAAVAGQEVYTFGSGTGASTCSTKSNLSSGTVFTYGQDGAGFAMTATNSSTGSGAVYYYDSNDAGGVTTTQPTGFPKTA